MLRAATRVRSSGRPIVTLLLMASLLLGAHGPQIVHARGAKLERPTLGVSLSFLSKRKKTSSWLQQKLAGRGFPARAYSIKGDKLKTKDLAIVIYVQRIRAFMTYRTSTNAPYLLLTLRDGQGRQMECVTSYPGSIVKGLSWTDFDKTSFAVPSFTPALIKACAIKRGPSKSYQAESREQFVKKYFGKWRILKRAHYAKLARDPRFVRTALEHGFYAFSGCYSGKLRIAE